MHFAHETFMQSALKPQGVSPVDLTLALSEIAPLAKLVREAAAQGSCSLQVYAARFDAPGETISLADGFRMLRELLLIVREETFQLSARPMLAGTSELVFSRAAGCSTVGQAMREIAHAYNLLHGGNYNQVEARGASLSYVLDDDEFPYTRPRDNYLHFSLECALIFVHSALCELADADLGLMVRQVSTRRIAGAHSGALAFWDAPVTHGAQVYAITYDAALATLPLRQGRRAMAPDLAVHNRIISLIEARELGASRREPVEVAVRRAFGDHLYEQDEIAARLGVSTATLRRRLAVEGASFRDLRHTVLKEQAKQMLAARQDIGGVAEALGFSDTRSFTRAFKGWTGLTPSAYLNSCP
jgi:AraC-like DNA-binding protein